MSTPVLRSPIAPHARALARLHSPRTAHRPAAGPRRRPGAAIVVVTRAAAASKGADTTGASGKKGKTNVTDMYVALREMERAAEEAETECVLNASNSSEQSKCTERYLEADIDIGSSAVANNVVRFVLGYVRTLVVDMCFLVEAKTEEELPERLIGTSRVAHLEPDAAVPPPPRE